MAEAPPGLTAVVSCRYRRGKEPNNMPRRYVCLKHHLTTTGECPKCEAESDTAPEVIAPVSVISITWMDEAKAALEHAPIKLNQHQEQLIKKWAADNPHGDLWGNDEAREINLSTFARSILNALKQGGGSSSSIVPVSHSETATGANQHNEET